jgi:hypothetical protein
MNWIKQWIRRVAFEAPPPPEQPQTRSRMYDMLVEANASFVVSRINNGYIVFTTPNETTGIRSSGFTYCADHQAIADHLVTAGARAALLPQTAMREKAQHAALGSQYAAKSASNPSF